MHFFLSICACVCHTFLVRVLYFQSNPPSTRITQRFRRAFGLFCSAASTASPTRVSSTRLPHRRAGGQRVRVHHLDLRRHHPGPLMGASGHVFSFRSPLILCHSRVKSGEGGQSRWSHSFLFCVFGQPFSMPECVGGGQEWGGGDI